MGTYVIREQAEMVQRVEKTRAEMRRHRQATPVKQPIHAGMTRVEAGLTRQEAERLVDGVCADLADRTERGERIANWTIGILAVSLGLALAIRPLAKHFGWMVGGQ